MYIQKQIELWQAASPSSFCLALFWEVSAPTIWTVGLLLNLPGLLKEILICFDS